MLQVNSMEEKKKASLHLVVISFEGDEVLWVRLVIMEHNIHARVREMIHHTIITVLTVFAFAKWRNPHVLMAYCVGASQNSGHYHELSPISRWL